jgi:hypothetical protein
MEEAETATKMLVLEMAKDTAEAAEEEKATIEWKIEKKRIYETNYSQRKGWNGKDHPFCKSLLFFEPFRKKGGAWGFGC